MMEGAAVFGCVLAIFGRENSSAESSGSNGTALGMLCVFGSVYVVFWTAVLCHSVCGGVNIVLYLFVDCAVHFCVRGTLLNIGFSDRL